LSGRGLSSENQKILQSGAELDEKQYKSIFNEYWNNKTKPSLYLSTNLGNIYTGSLYACLISLISDDKIYLEVSYSESQI
jgi:3-hydroxy-3-methylglutaryl CoA synthase